MRKNSAFPSHQAVRCLKIIQSCSLRFARSSTIAAESTAPNASTAITAVLRSLVAGDVTLSRPPFVVPFVVPFVPLFVPPLVVPSVLGFVSFGCHLLYVYSYLRRLGCVA